LFVGNISFQSNVGSLKKFFSEVGTVLDARIALGEDGRPRGFAHVEFASVEEAEKAMELNGQELDGRALRLDLSSNKPSGGGRGGRGGDRGGFRGGDRGGRGFRGGDRGGRGFRGGGGFRGRGSAPPSTNRAGIQEYKGKK